MSNPTRSQLLSSFQTALLSGDSRTVRTCLEQGLSADLRMPQRQGRPARETPLMLAAEAGSPAIAKLLLDRGADVNATSEFQQTALLRAIRNNHAAIVNLLLKHQAEIDPDCLIEAAVADVDARIMRSLLKHGADPNRQNKQFRQTAIHMAAFHGNLDVARQLIRAGVDVNLRDKHGSGPLSCAIQNKRNAIILLLIKNGSDPKLQPEALGMAVWHGQPAIVKLLIENGWDLHSKAYQGRTPLAHATNRKHKAIVKLLKDAGALR